MRKIMITGFSGFVSYYFLQYLNEVVSQEESFEILGVDLKLPDDYESNYNFKNIHIRFLSMNLMDFSALEIAITSFAPNYILHLASLSSVGASWKDPIGCFMNNTNIFLNLVEAVRKSGIKCRILSIGSSEEYGNVDKKNIPLLETSLLQPISPYAIARVSQEMLSKCYVDSMGLDIVLTRSFNHIGPRQREVFVVPSFIKQVIDGKENGLKKIELSTGNLEIVRDFLDVRDVVRAYYLLLVKGKRGELYNVCSGNGYTLRQVLELIAEIEEVELETIIDKRKIRPNDNMIIIGNNTKLVSETGWNPMYNIRQTLQDMLDYRRICNASLV